MENRKDSIGVQFTSLNNEVLTKQMIEKFNKIVLTWFEKHNILPTYWGINGEGLSNKLTKFSLKKLSNLENKKSFLDKDGNLIEGITYCLNPEKSDSPSYDSFIDMNIYYTDYSAPNFKTDSKKLKLCFKIDPNHIQIEPEDINHLLNKFSQIFEVDYAMIYFNKDYIHVSAETMEYSDGKYSGEKKRSYKI